MGTAVLYKDLPSYHKKFVQFCYSQHCEELPLLPLFPVKLSTLLRFAWWCQYHKVTGGLNSIRNFISAVCEWNSSLGFEDPRHQEKWVYDRFRREADKYLEVFEGSKAKFRLTHELIQAIMRFMDISDLEVLADAVTYSVLAFTAIRRGHLVPKAITIDGLKHMLRWENIRFIPNPTIAHTVLFMLETGKVRCAAKKDPWWTATGVCPVAYMCPVKLLSLWYLRTYSGDPKQYVMAPSLAVNPRTTGQWTRDLRARLKRVAKLTGCKEFDATKYAGISFRKFALSALAPHVQPTILAAHGEHKSVETTNTYYVSQSVQQRAGHTEMISRELVK